MDKKVMESGGATLFLNTDTGEMTLKFNANNYIGDSKSGMSENTMTTEGRWEIPNTAIPGCGNLLINATAYRKIDRNLLNIVKEGKVERGSRIVPRGQENTAQPTPVVQSRKVDSTIRGLSDDTIAMLLQEAQSRGMKVTRK